MLIVYLEKLNIFAKNHANARKSVATWVATTEESTWNTKQDVLRSFPNAKMIADNRARFEIVHNTYRLIAKVNYEAQIVQIRFIGTHSEYDRIDPSTI
ncbi:MAG: type II toxin-antitoxin system HigB family toxin [Chitinophagaceae bacterium]